MSNLRVNRISPFTGSKVTIIGFSATGSLQGTSSFAENASTASYVEGYTLEADFNTFTSSYITDSGSFSTRTTNLEQFSSSLDATFVNETEFANYTGSADNRFAALELESGSIRNDFNVFTGSYNIDSGSFSTRITDLESFSSSLDATFVNETEFATYTGSVDSRLNSLEVESGSIRSDFNLFTSSYNTGSFTGSFTGDGSGLSGVTAETASYVLGSNVNGAVSLANTSSYILGSNVDGAVNIANTSSYILGSNVDGTVSNATNAVTASYILASGVDGTVANAISSSYAITASYALNVGAGSGFPFSGSAIITGSLLVSGSNVDFNNATGVSGSFSGSFQGDGSGLTGIISSSYASTSSYTHANLQQITDNGNVTTNNIIISGSLIVTSSLSANGLTYPGTVNANKGWHLETDGDGNVVIDRTRIYADVKNATAGTLLKGTPVHVSSSIGNIDEIIAASASNAATMPATFVLAEDLAAGAEGLAILTGFINGVNTSGFGEGDVIYVDYNGGYTNIKPTGSAQIQNLGIVTAVGVNGSGFVYGSGRATDTPNLLNGNIFYGVGDTAVKKPLADVITGSFFNYTGSLQGTASYALLAETASYTITTFVTQSVLAETASFVTASGVYGPYGSNSIISSSYAVTSLSSSYAVTASYALSSTVSRKFSSDKYMFNVITAGGPGYNWNGVSNVGAPGAAIVSTTHPHRLYNFAGTNNGHEGIYFEQGLPSYYTAGTNIKVTLNVAGDTLTGGAVFYCGLTQPSSSNVLGGTTETEWLSQTATFTGVTGFQAIPLTYTFTGTTITPNDVLLFRIYRDPNDGGDTLTADVALVTIAIEEV